MGKKKAEKTTVVKDHKNIDQLLIHANYVVEMFDIIFDTSHRPEVKAHNGTISIMCFDMALLYIKYSGDNIICVMSVFDECSVLLVAELTCCLKDIFGAHIFVNEDTYIQDNANKDLIWGRDNIDDHNEKVWGRKIQHSIWFDDTCAGHS